MGTRLRNLVKQYKGTKTPLHGRGKLTNKVVNSLQNFYGIAIRQNCDSLYQMKKAVGAILWHCCDTDKDDEYRHQYCPPGTSSWCKFKRDKETNKNTYKKTINLPEFIHSILQPVFLDLSKDELLSKCLHGQTQNANEAFNSVVWTKCPKTVFVSRQILEIGVNSAVLQFNEGAHGITNVLKHFLINCGVYTNFGSEVKNHSSVSWSNSKSSATGKARRKRLRGIKKNVLDVQKENETDSYVPGGF